MNLCQEGNNLEVVFGVIKDRWQYLQVVNDIV